MGLGISALRIRCHRTNGRGAAMHAPEKGMPTPKPAQTPNAHMVDTEQHLKVPVSLKSISLPFP